MKKILLGLMIMSFNIFIGCASIQANEDLNKQPEDVARGDPLNNQIVREYLHNVLLFPKGREVKVYTRRPFSPKNKKNFLMYHMFYVYLKNGRVEHTLVFTATPQGAEYNGCWMLDAPTDVDSINLYLASSENIWEVEEYTGPKGETVLDMVKTTNKILERLESGYTFFGPSSIRNIPWYHILWLTLVPPPFTPQVLMLISLHKDNCTSAVFETIVWEEN